MPKLATHGRAWIALALLSLCTACSSTKSLEARPLPFHAVVVPIDAPLVGAVSEGELPGNETELRVDITPEELGAVMGSALQEYCFERVTVLDTAAESEGSDALERGRAAIAAARAAGADLVVEFGLRYDGEIFRESAGIFWLNWPLFFFAGPSAWFLGDNGYYADVELTTTVYDLNMMEAGGLELGDPAARVLVTSARYAGAALTYTSRSDGVGDYALGILAPSGYLSRESDSTEAEVEVRILDDLLYQLVQGIQSRRGDLVSAEWIAPMFVDPDQVRLVRSDGEVLVTGKVRLLRGGLAQRVQVLELTAGGRTVSVHPVPDLEAGTERYVVLPFEARVPVAAGAAELRMECLAGSRDRFVRSYTFKLPSPSSEG